MTERIEAFQKLLEADPNDPLLHYGLGLELLKAGRAGEAAREFAEAARLHPDHTAAYREWGRALERAGRAEEAREAWRRGVEVSHKTGDIQTRKEMEVFLRRLGEEHHPKHETLKRPDLALQQTDRPSSLHGRPDISNP